MLEFKLEDETPFPHKEVTEAIIGSAFEVYNHLGYGFLHRVYQRALQVELLRRGFSGELERRTTVRYKEVIVGEYDGDMIVNDAVLIEVKIAPQYDKRDEAQLLNVLKATGLKIGILLNFGRYKVEYKRLIFCICVHLWLKGVNGAVTGKTNRWGAHVALRAAGGY
jgi:GxxExxY protein